MGPGVPGAFNHSQNTWQQLAIRCEASPKFIKHFQTAYLSWAPNAGHSDPRMQLSQWLSRCLGRGGHATRSSWARSTECSQCILIYCLDAMLTFGSRPTPSDAFDGIHVPAEHQSHRKWVCTFLNFF